MIRTNPQLWERIVKGVKEGSRGGNPGEWSARKAQIAVREYKEAGGGYRGNKPKGGLVAWTEQDWMTKSGKPSLETGERYLPRKAIKKLSPQQYEATSRIKRAGMKKGEQFVKQPKSIAEIVKEFR
jgi:hypothetical protein